MRIRKATEDDMEAAALIYKECFDKEPYKYMIKEEESLDIIKSYFKTQVMYVAIDNDSVIGFVMGEKYLWVGGWRLWISELFVDSNHQRKGVGTQLLSAIENHFKKDGISFVELLAHNNAEAIKFYEKLDFHRSDYAKFEKKIS
jgi:ribosomal protein S18 acetylase RimI-like enzyme